MAYADQQMSGSRIVAIIIVALVHIALGYALITGLAYEAATKLVERVTTIDVEEPPPPPPPPEEEPPPPEPQQQQTAPPPPVAPPPPINIAPAPPPIRTQTNIPPPAPPALRIPPPAPVAPPAPPAPPPAPPAPSKARGASPDNQGRWARQIQDNYPRSAERAGEEGSVGVRVTIGADGRVSNCTVTSSSGSSALDSGACDGMRRYARFNPALDRAGNPITDTYSTRIVYQLN